MKLNKLGKRITSGIVALATAVSMASVFPSMNIISNANTTDNFPVIPNITEQICENFGSLYNEAVYNAKAVSLTDGFTSANKNAKQSYCNDVASGYTFAMSQFKSSEQQLTITHDDGTTSTITGVSNIPNNKGRFIDPQDTDKYYGNKITASIDFNNKKDYVGSLDTYPYAIKLTKYDKEGKTSYLYPNCGEYNGKKVDVKLSIVDFDESDDVISQDGVGTLFTSAEYSYIVKQIPDSKACFIKMKTAITYNGNSYVYAIPMLNYSKASKLGVFKTANSYTGNKPERNNKYYTDLGPILSFTSSKVGVTVYGVNWITLKYDFYEHDTNNKITVKGYTCWKDIDGHQGVYFKEGSGIKLKAWTNSSRFASGNIITGSGTKYSGYFDRIGDEVYDSDKDTENAWLYGTFTASSMVAVYSFCGPQKSGNLSHGLISPNDSSVKGSNYSSTGRLKRTYSGSGTIQNDLPDVDFNFGLHITKQIHDTVTGKTYVANKKNNEFVNTNLRIYLKDSKGNIVKVSKNKDNDGNTITKGNYKYNPNGTITDMQLTDNGTLYIGNNLPVDTYTVYEKGASGYSPYKYQTVYDYNDPDKTTTSGTWTNFGGKNYFKVNGSINDDGKLVDWNASNKTFATKHVRLTNETNLSFNVQKNVKLFDGTSTRAGKVTGELQKRLHTLNQHLRFILKDSNGEKHYAYINQTNTDSDNLEYAKFTGLAAGEYTLAEQTFDKDNAGKITTPSKNTTVSAWKTIYTEKIYLNEDGTVTKAKDGNDITVSPSGKTVVVTNPLKTKEFQIIKKLKGNSNPSPEEISGIKFTLTGKAIGTNESITKTLITDENGVTNIVTLPYGTYTIKEDPNTTPEGYQSVTASVKIDDNTANTYAYSLTNSKDVGNLEIVKEIEGETNPDSSSIKNISFRLSDDEGNVFTATTDETGKAYIENIPVGTYTLKETSVPFGFEKMEDTKIEIKSKETTTYTVTNKYSSISIDVDKYDSDTKEGLAGAEFDIFEDVDKDGNYNKDTDKYIGHITYDEETGLYAMSGLEIKKQYLIKETVAPDGYFLDDTYHVADLSLANTIKQESLNYTVDFPNTPKTFNIQVAKTQSYKEVSKDGVVGKTVTNKASDKLKQGIQFAIYKTETENNIVNYEFLTADENNKFTGFTKFTEETFSKNGWLKKLQESDVPKFSLNEAEDDNTLTITNVPEGTYTIVEVPIADSTSSKCWDTGEGKRTETITVTNNDINKKGYVKSVTFNNPECTIPVTIIKKVEDSEGNEIHNPEYVKGVGFTLLGQAASDNRTITRYGKTDENGELVFEDVPYGVYTIIEDPSTVNKLFQVADDTMIALDESSNETGENVITVRNRFDTVCKINIHKFDELTKKALTGAEFTVYKDVNKNGKYDADVDTEALISEEKINFNYEDNIYKMMGAGLSPDYYLVKETKAPDGYYLNDNYYPVHFDTSNLTEQTATVTVDIPDKPKPASLVITKRISAKVSPDNLWFEHGDPTFIFKVTNTNKNSKDYGTSYMKSVQFTKDYVDSHTVTDAQGNKYVEMSVTFDNLEEGTYTAEEAVQVIRYKFKEIINIEKGATEGSKCNFTLKPLDVGKATFVNVKTRPDLLTHNSLCVNVIKK